MLFLSFMHGYGSTISHSVEFNNFALSTADGLKYYDIVEGKGPVAEKGSTVEVHFDCKYKGITAVSSRESKLLAGNRAIAQVTNYMHFLIKMFAFLCVYEMVFHIRIYMIASAGYKLNSTVHCQNCCVLRKKICHFTN